MLGDDLHLAALLVEREASAKQEVQAVLGAETQQRSLTAEKYGCELALVVLEREINVAGGGRPQVANLAFHPEIGEFTLDLGAQFPHEFADLPDAALLLRRCSFKAEAELGRF